jgi:hypothetical protein
LTLISLPGPDARASWSLPEGDIVTIRVQLVLDGTPDAFDTLAPDVTDFVFSDSGFNVLPFAGASVQLDVSINGGSAVRSNAIVWPS